MSPAHVSHPASALQTAVALSPFAGARPDPHHLLWAVDIDGPVDFDALRQALHATVARHPGLCSVFRWRDARFEVHETAASRVIFDRTDLRPEAADAAACAFGEQPYDLEHGPLHRFRLLRTGPDRHVLLCAFHHLVIDGTSWPIFVRDLATALEGKPLPPPPAQAEAARDSAAARAFWQDHVQGLGSVFELPSGTGGPRDSDGRHLTAPLPASVSQALHASARALGTSPFRMALAVFAALLSRLARRGDIALGTVLAGRPLTGDDAVGFHVNTTLLRAEVTETTTLRGLCAVMGDTLDQCVRHQGWPMREAARAFGLSHDPRVNAFTEAAFVKMPRRLSLRAADLALRERRIFLGGTERDLCVYFQETAGGFETTWSWRASRFGAETVARWQVLYARLLEQALADPDAPLDRLDLVAPEERRQLLNIGNATRHDFAGRDVLHRLVEAQVRRTPERICVISPGRQWTYREINAAANRLAAQLAARGIGRGGMVPLLMDPSAEMLIAELAVMKTGAAFVPLSPDWPAGRIAELLARLGGAPVLAAGTPRHLPGGADVIDVAADTGRSDPGDPQTVTSLDDAIYCIFTSGSTGTPKGALNRHRGIVNRLLSMTRHLGHPEADTVLATAPGTTDTLTWQYFWPLTHGGRVVTAPRREVVVPEGICRLIARHGVTFIDLVPSVFKLLTNHLRDTGADIPTLRMVLVGGETMNPQDVRTFRALRPATEVLNTYGPTETSIGVLWHRVTDPVEDPIPLGRPFDNIVAIVLDRHGNLAPQGLAGELCVGGDCIGLGYLGDPAATRDRFIANPFPELQCDTLYRTGDLARLRPDGLIDYLGRLDDQIKIRGHRVEPGEIEAALQAHPAVEQAVVTAAPGTSVLTAFLVFRDGLPVPSAAELRQTLSARLPRHMVPQAFVGVPHIPVRPGGKIDRAAVAALPGQALRDHKPFVPPQGTDEAAVAEVWRAVLGIARIGRDDNFFHDLGGDSLKALIFVMQWEERTGRRTEVSRLFEAPTVAAFAGAPPPDVRGLLDRQRAHLSTWREGRAEPGGFLFARNASGPRPPLFWCCQGYEELDQLARHLDPRQPLTGMRSGHLIMDYTPDAIAELANAYAAEIDRRQPEGPIMLGGNCQGAVIAHGVAAALRRRGRRTGPLILMEESDFRPHDGPVVLLYGRDSHLNPFRNGADPSQTLRDAYPAGFSVSFIPGRHGLFFTPENVPGLAAAIEAVMSRTVSWP